MEVTSINHFLNIGHLVYWAIVVSTSIISVAYVSGKIIGRNK
jgi:hypothetical protein